MPEDTVVNAEDKSWYLSKTLWVNLIAGVAVLTGAFKIDLGLTPEVQATVVTTILAVVNIILRLTTKGAVTA